MERGDDANALGIYGDDGFRCGDASADQLDFQEVTEVFFLRGAAYYIAAYGKLSVVGTTTITSTREMINAAGFTSR